MDLQIYDVTTGQVLEEWDNVPSGMFNRTIVVNPPVGANQLAFRIRPAPSSTGCTAVGAAITAQQAKR